MIKKSEILGTTMSRLFGWKIKETEDRLKVAPSFTGGTWKATGCAQYNSKRGSGSYERVRNNETKYSGNSGLWGRIVRNNTNTIVTTHNTSFVNQLNDFLEGRQTYNNNDKPPNL